MMMIIMAATYWALGIVLSALQGMSSKSVIEFSQLCEVAAVIIISLIIEKRNKRLIVVKAAQSVSEEADLESELSSLWMKHEGLFESWRGFLGTIS